MPEERGGYKRRLNALSSNTSCQDAWNAWQYLQWRNPVENDLILFLFSQVCEKRLHYLPYKAVEILFIEVQDQ
jgi:hypothetical protein